MSINKLKLSKYISEEKIPFENEFQTFWISALNTKENKQIKSECINDNENLRDNLISFFKDIDDSNNKNNCYSEQISQFAYIKKTIGKEQSESFIFHDNINILISKIHDKVSYDIAMKKYRIIASEKSKLFFNDIQLSYNLSKEEVEFLFPNYSNIIISISIFLEQMIKEIEEYCRART